MLGEVFVEQCITFCVSVDKLDIRSKNALDSLRYILRYYKEEILNNKNEIFTNNKFDLLSYLVKYRESVRNEYDFQDLLQRISIGKFSENLEYIKLKRRELGSDELDKILNEIIKKRKICELFKGKHFITESIQKLEHGIFDDEEDAINNWENVVSKLYSQILCAKREERLSDSVYFDMRQDDYEYIMSELRENSKSTECLRTGYGFLKRCLPTGGFEPTRLYLIGGTSGSGKSAMLANFISNAVFGCMQKKEKRETFLYITAENLITETLERIYCIMTGTPVSELKKRYLDPSFSLQPELKSIFNKYNSNVVICYVKPKLTTLRDIEMLMDKVISQDYQLKGVFVDYLDLIRSGYGLSELRHELGEVTIGLKNLAVIYRVPIITVTQLNRGGYGEGASLIDISESMQKVDNSDFVMVLQEDVNEPFFEKNTSLGLVKYKQLKVSILKNRNGKKGQCTTFLMQDQINDVDCFNFRIEEKIQMIKEDSSFDHCMLRFSDPSITTTSTTLVTNTNTVIGGGNSNLQQQWCNTRTTGTVSITEVGVSNTTEEVSKKISKWNVTEKNSSKHLSNKDKHFNDTHNGGNGKFSSLHHNGQMVMKHQQQWCDDVDEDFFIDFTGF